MLPVAGAASGAGAGAPSASAGMPTADTTPHASHGTYFFLRPNVSPPPDVSTAQAERYPASRHKSTTFAVVSIKTLPLTAQCQRTARNGRISSVVAGGEPDARTQRPPPPYERPPARGQPHGDR